MHKLILKTFEFIKNVIKFIQILFLIGILLTLLYWVQNITNDNWGWMSACAPFLNILINLGQMFSDKSISLFGAVFEYKYFIAVILYIVLYYLGNLCLILTDLGEKVYLKCHETAKKAEENLMNQSLQTEEQQQRNMLKTYKVFVALEVKKHNYGLEVINIDEQNKMMNKFLISKTGIMPTTYENGFVYNFVSFKTIDGTVDALFKLFEAQLPLNYYICIQAFGLDKTAEEEMFANLIKLKLANKIITSAATNWRYSSNMQHRHETRTLGLFQKNDESYEVFEFIPKK